MVNFQSHEFVKKSEAVLAIPRSARQLTRDVGDAINSRDLEALACFQLRTSDETISASELESVDQVKELKVGGKKPEWFVNANLWRQLLDERAASRVNKVANVETSESGENEQKASRLEHDQANDEINGYLAELLAEKNERIAELKEDKVFYQNVLENLLGKDMLTALANIAGDGEVDAQKLSTLVLAASKTDTQSTQSPRPETKDVKTSTAIQNSVAPAQSKPAVVVDAKIEPLNLADVESPIKPKVTKRNRSRSISSKSKSRAPKKKQSASKKGGKNPAVKSSIWTRPIKLPWHR